MKRGDRAREAPPCGRSGALPDFSASCLPVTLQRPQPPHGSCVQMLVNPQAVFSWVHSYTAAFVLSLDGKQLGNMCAKSGQGLSGAPQEWQPFWLQQVFYTYPHTHKHTCVHAHTPFQSKRNDFRSQKHCHGSVGYCGGGLWCVHVGLPKSTEARIGLITDTHLRGSVR